MLIKWLLTSKGRFVVLALLALLLTTYCYNSVYSSGYEAGKNLIQSRWDLDKAKLQKEISNLNIKLEYKEKQYKQINLMNQTQLTKLKNEYEAKINDITNSFNNQLLLSEQRANLYKRKANSGSTQCRDVADHAARLDKDLTEGIYLVSELTEHIKLRDGEIKRLSTQLLNDRHLMEK